MASMIAIRGVSDIRRALASADKQIASNMRRGLAKAALLLQRYSQEVVPIDTSNLKNSAGTRLIGSGWDSDAIVFYTAAYAVYVHERTDLKHAPGKQAKFLEGPMREHREELLKVIWGEAGRNRGSMLPPIGAPVGAGGRV